MLILIEGMDGMGKSTLIHNLDLYLSQYPNLVYKKKYPSHKARTLLRKFLWFKYLCLLVFYLDFLLDKQDIITSLAVGNKNYHVVIDRYWLSTLCYQLGTNKPLWLNKLFIRLCKKTLVNPDLTIWLRGSVELAQMRIHSRCLGDSLDTYMENLDNLYMIHKNYSTFTSYMDNCYAIDANKSPEELLNQSITLINSYISNY